MFVQIRFIGRSSDWLKWESDLWCGPFFGSSVTVESDRSMRLIQNACTKHFLWNLFGSDVTNPKIRVEFIF